jgi:ferric-dicitrate binding protein FerR (iron transport regulator)
MAEFTITGQRNGHPVSVTWRDGALTSNDHATAQWLQELARQLEGTIQGLPGLPSTMHDHLSSPYTACALMRSVFPGPVTQDQPLPPLALPPGAIA